MMFFLRRKRRRSIVRTVVDNPHYRAHRARAQRVIVQRVVYWATQMENVQYNRITIRNTRTRWGSCSSQRNLNFHYGLLFLSDDLRDYVIVHELCHLQEMNHAPAFWAIVARYVPDYRARRAVLRAQSPQSVLHGNG